jgi:hypothetical protein
MDGRLTKIIPEYDITTKQGYRYPEVDTILETQSEETVKILNDLYEEGILKREFYDKIFQCQKCGSFQVKLNPVCPNCNSFNLSKDRTIEHLECGHVDFEENFKTEKGYVCPKCGKELKQIGVDYSRPGILYKCRDCNEIFGEPLDRWRCMKCLSTFPRMEIKEKDIYTYTLNDAVRDKILLEIRPKRQIEEFLKRGGYDVQSSTRIAGRSGMKHEVDIFAVKKSGIFEHKIIIGLSSAEHEVGPEEVLRLFAKAQDIGVHESVLIAIPKASKDTKFFAAYHGIRCIEASELDQALKELEGRPLKKEERGNERDFFQV